MQKQKMVEFGCGAWRTKWGGGQAGACRKSSQAKPIRPTLMTCDRTAIVHPLDQKKIAAFIKPGLRHHVRNHNIKCHTRVIFSEQCD